ncbi:MAG: DNA polymerase III subunit delta' [Acidobacteriia bacterium]|nr:DNA polymerase III subunit delta' [Terriglobia bacterium]
MSFREILGQRAAIDLLRRVFASGRLPHALLFQGPAGVGKALAARALAAALQCREGGPDACGTCPPCVKLAQGNHPDFLWFTRLPKKEAASRGEEPGEAGADDTEDLRSDLKRDITIEQIRDLADHASYAPREGRRRVFAIDPADRMNLSAQNALLKTLEEPPGSSLLVLVTSRPQVLLPTVRSRCFVVRFAAMPTDALAAALESRGVPHAEALARAALSEGRPRIAAALDVEARRARREEILSAIETVAARGRGLAKLPALASKLAGRDEESLIEGLDLVEALLRDAERAALELPAGSLVHADLHERLSSLGRDIGPERAAEIIRFADRVRDDLRFSLNKTLVAEALLAAIAGAPVPY